MRLELLAAGWLILGSLAMDMDLSSDKVPSADEEPEKVSPPADNKNERDDMITQKLRSMRRRYSRQRELKKSRVDEAAQRVKNLIKVQMILLTHTSNVFNTDYSWNEVSDYKGYPFFQQKLEELLQRPMQRRQTRLQRQLEVIDEFVEFIDDWRVEYCNDPALAEAPYEDQLVDKAKRNQDALNKWLLRLQDYVRRPESMRVIKRATSRRP